MIKFNRFYILPTIIQLTIKNYIYNYFVTRMNKGVKHDLQKLFDLSGMPSSMHYFIVYPYEHEQQNEEVIIQQPVLITYYREDTKLIDLIKQFQSKVPKYKNQKGLNFCLAKGGSFERYKTMKHLKKDLRRTNLDGIIFYIKRIQQQQEQYPTEFHKSKIQEQINPKYDDENCIIKMYQIDRQTELTQLNLKFQLMLSEEPIQITLGIHYEDQYKDVTWKLCNHLLSGFEIINIQSQMIQKMVIEKTGELINNRHKICYNSTLQQNSKIQVYFKNGMLTKLVKKINKSRYLKIIDVQDGNDRAMVQVLYDQIKYLSFEEFYQIFFKKQAETTHTKYYLRFLDILMSPSESFISIQKFFRDNIVNIGEVISERLGFYKDLQQKTQQIQFRTIFEMIEIENYERERAIQFHSDKINSIRFRSRTVNPTPPRIFESIYLYSSEIIVREERKTIYNTINTFLRNQFSLETPLNTYNSSWKYRFIKNLVNSLAFLKPVQNTKVYRGVDYLPPQKQGSFITFKNFLSTSFSKEAAQKFALQRNKLKQQNDRQHTVFIINLISGNGRDLNGYTQYKQQEVLLFPFSKFLVTNVYDKVENNGITFHYFELQQIQQLYKTTELRTKIILWVDDNRQEGKQIFQKNISKSPLLRSPLIFEQFISTQQLVRYMDRCKDVLCYQSADVLFISDMKRNENGSDNFKAGIQGMRQIIKMPKFKQPHLIFYVGNKKATEKLLDDADFSDSEIKNVQIIDYPTDLIKKIDNFFTNSIIVQSESSFCQIC